MPDMSAFESARTMSNRQAKIVTVLERLEQEDPDRHAALVAALANPEYTSAGIARVLRGWGFDLSEDGVQKWRKNRL